MVVLLRQQGHSVDFISPSNGALRIVRIGDYDACACIGAHVENTAEIGHFKMLTYDYQEGRLRLRFKLTE